MKNKESSKNQTSRNALLIRVMLIIIIFLFFKLSPVFGATPTATVKTSRPNIILAVPFTSQAPLAEWNDERQEDGCEEATALMALAWVKNEKVSDKYEWRTRILKLSDWEQKKYGEYRDVSLYHILVWIFGDYFSYGNVAIKPVRDAAEILQELEKGHIVLAPMDGQALKNPYFTAPGPERHMILIKGYDYQTAEFITHDPGTRRGENYRYSGKVLFDAIRVYRTGYHVPFGEIRKEMIVVGK